MRRYIIFEIKRGTHQFFGRKDQFHSRIKARNGEIMWHAEEYNSKQACIKTVKSMIKLMKPNTYKVKVIDGKKKEYLEL